MKIEKVKFEDVKDLICIRGTHAEVYAFVDKLKKGESAKVILDNPKTALNSLLTGRYLRLKQKKDYTCYRLKDKKGWIIRK